MAKVKLVMKRLRDVQPGDVMVGRGNWQKLTALRPVMAVIPSEKKPGKLSLWYQLEERSSQGRVRRWPDFYVICLKDPCTCSGIDYCERCLLLMSRR